MKNIEKIKEALLDVELGSGAMIYVSLGDVQAPAFCYKLGESLASISINADSDDPDAILSIDGKSLWLREPTMQNIIKSVIFDDNAEDVDNWEVIETFNINYHIKNSIVETIIDHIYMTIPKSIEGVIKDGTIPSGYDKVKTFNDFVCQYMTPVLVEDVSIGIKNMSHDRLSGSPSMKVAKGESVMESMRRDFIFNKFEDAFEKSLNTKITSEIEGMDFFAPFQVMPLHKKPKTVITSEMLIPEVMIYLNDPKDYIKKTIALLAENKYMTKTIIDVTYANVVLKENPEVLKSIVKKMGLMYALYEMFIRADRFATIHYYNEKGKTKSLKISISSFDTVDDGTLELFNQMIVDNEITLNDKREKNMYTFDVDNIISISTKEITLNSDKSFLDYPKK